MATINYFVRGKKKLVPIFVRFLDGTEHDFLVKSGLMVNPDTWSNKTQSIKQRVRTDTDNSFIKELADLKGHLNNELRVYTGTYSKDWLETVINSYHSKGKDSANNLNGYIEDFLSKAEAGNEKNKGAVNFAPGTLRALRGFQRIFNQYQGVYSEKDVIELREKKKNLRPKRITDFEDITISFYRDFVSFLTDEGYQVNTTGRFIKQLKYLMRKSLAEGLHKNRAFMDGAFSGFTEDSHAVYLSMDEIENIWKYDLSKEPRMELARDTFIVLCETGLRISDYHKVEFNIRERKIYINQTKTSDPVVIPISVRMQSVLNKYNGQLPKIHEVYVNKYIKTICAWCKIDSPVSWITQKKGKRYETTKKKYELISNHSGRRSFCTNAYLLGIPTIDIMRISGHRSEHSFMKYIRVTNEQVADRLASHPFFNGHLKAV